MLEVPLHIFIADDDADDRSFVIDALERNGYTGLFTCFGNGALMMEYLSLKDILLPSAILLDLNMPMKDGYQTLRELKAAPFLAHIPVFVLSSSTNEKDLRICQQLGCDKFYSKPSSVEAYDPIATEILNCVSKLFEQLS